MAAALLATKLNVPSPQSRLVSRQRLIDRLDEGLRLGHRLTLVSAPAGFGKTTLLGEWVHASVLPVAWLSLDDGDNDPARFLAYLAAALQRTGVDLDSGVSADASVPATVTPFLTALLNQINEAPENLILVLDDYHLITAQPVHDALTFLLDHMPANMHLVIATRADPPLPVARLRGRGQLTELRLTDLRFTVEEAAGFLEQVMRLALSADDVTALASRTEGWIAGLQMAALSLQGREDVSRFIAEFTGSNRYVLDYLLEEVLRREPEDVQAFLLQTSILDRLCGPLCDAVLAEGAEMPGQEVLERLESANLFILPLDNERRWYRYHRLFSDLLRQRLQRMYPGRAPALHQRASVWFEQNELAIQAIEHALAAGDSERAADLVDSAAEAALMRGEVTTLMRWVDALPGDLVRARPALCVYHAWALLLNGHSLDVVESRLQDAGADFVSPQAAPLYALVAIFQGEMVKGIELSRRALVELPEENVFLRNFASWLLGVSQMADGELVAGSQTLDEAIRTSREAGNLLVAVGALTNLGRLRRRQGRLHEAKAAYDQALELATDDRGRTLPVAGWAFVGLGGVLLEWNDLEAAERHLVEGIELIEQWRRVAGFPGYVSLARVRQARGDADGAREALQRAQQLTAEFDITDWDDALVAAYQAQLWIDQDNIEAAVQWAEERDRARAAGEIDAFVRDHLRRYEDVVLARLALVQGQPDKALALLDPLLPIVEERGRRVSEIEIHILKALAFQAKGDGRQALAALKRALVFAEPGGYVRIFLDEGSPGGDGEPMVRLLREAARRDIAAEYVSKLLAAFGADVSSPLGSPALVEPLSEREMEVLRLLRTHLSSTEIAEELFIAPSTARTHIKSIYSKLDVHSRKDAVRRAEELALV